MNLQVIGVLLLTAGVWVVYSGVSGFNPLEVVQKIARNPGEASSIIAGEKTPLSVKSSSSSGDGVTDSSKPLTSLAVVCGFACHQARNSGSPGVDFRAPVGTPIITPVSGKVTNASYPPGYGNYVTITTKDGYRIHFGHLSKFSVKNNTEVKAGTVVGLSGGAVGSPGAGNSTGPHIHMDVQPPGSRKHIDPIKFLAGARITQEAK